MRRKNTDKNKVTVAIYTRKSVVLTKGDTLEVQKEKCYAEARHKLEDKEIEFREYSDQMSGATLDRPKMQELRDAVENGEIDYIFCYKLDRLGRSALDVLSLVDEFDSKRVTLVIVNDNIDTSITTSKLLITILASVAEIERHSIIERVMDSYVKLASMGYWMGGKAPLGYKSEYVENKGLVNTRSKKIAVLKQVPEERELVEYIFDEYTKGEEISLVELAHRVQAKGYSTRKGNIRFDQHSLADIIRNPACVKATKSVRDWYLQQGVREDNISSIEKFDGVHGLLVNNKTTKSKMKIEDIINDAPEKLKHSYILDLKEEDIPDTIHLSEIDWIVAVAPHEGFIDDEVWLKAQERLNSRAGKRDKLNTRHNNVLFNGKFTCKKCGNIISYFNRASKTDSSIQYPIYRCEGKRKHHDIIGKENCRCDVENINATELDSKIVDIIFGMIPTYLSCKDYLSEFKTRKVSSSTVSVVDGMRKEIDNIDRCIRRMIKNTAQSDLDKATMDLYNQEIRNYSNRKEELKKAIEKIALDDETTKKELTNLDALPEELIHMDRTVFDSLPMPKKRHIVSNIIDSLEWDGENVYVHFVAEEKIKKAC